MSGTGGTHRLPARRLPRIRTIRVRLALLLAVPTVLLVALAGVGVAGSSDQIVKFS